MGSLGIYDGHNSSVSFVNNNKIILSVEEERFSRIKGHDARVTSHGMPKHSLKWVLENIKDRNLIDYIALALEEPKKLSDKSLTLWSKAIQETKDLKILDFFSNFSNDQLKKYSLDQSGIQNLSYNSQNERISRIKNLLVENSLEHIPIKLFPHHKCHHASNWYTSYCNDSFVVSLDGRGDALSGAISIFENGKIKILHEINALHSLGHFYSAITVCLGFKAVKHEGKITGLAAYAKPDSNLLKKFKKLIWIDSKSGSPISTLFTGGAYGPYPYADARRYSSKISELIKKYSKEVVASTAQFHLEESVKKLIQFWSLKTKKNSVMLSGGVFANVKLNQKISEISHIKKVVVHPGMGDCGISCGAAFLAENKIPSKFHHYDFYLGPEYDDKYILDFLTLNQINYSTPKNLAQEVAKLLSKNKVIARFSGKLEYGPRALGNRSILYQAKDASVNNWLNKQLSRTEFMPFAPVTLEEDCEKSYIIPPNTDLKYSMRYMTITVKCKDYLRKVCPAVVHVDGTARPQIIERKLNPGYYDIVSEYKKITGIGTLVNTSFNLHDEPIVKSPEEAFEAFYQSKLNYLILGKYLVSI